MDLQEGQITNSMEERTSLWRKRKSLEPGEADAILKRRKSITSINEIERLPDHTSSNFSNINLTSLPSFTDAFPEKHLPSSDTVQTAQPTNQIVSTPPQLQSTENVNTIIQKPKQFQTQTNVASSLNVELNNKANKLELPGIKRKYYNPSYSADIYPFKRHSFVSLEAARNSYKISLNPPLLRDNFVPHAKPDLITKAPQALGEPINDPLRGRRNAIIPKESEQMIHSARRSLDLSSTRSRYSADSKFWDKMLNNFGETERKVLS